MASPTRHTLCQEGCHLRSTPNVQPNAAAALTAVPGAIVFLNARNASAHEIEPLDRVTALTRLTRENVRVYERGRRDQTARWFDAMWQHVRCSNTFHVSCCSELEAIPSLLEGLPEA